MPDAKSGRVHLLRQLAVTGGVTAEGTGNHFLLRLTRRCQRCRSGSEISGAGLYQRQGARGWCGSVESCGIRDELNDRLLPLKINSTNSRRRLHIALSKRETLARRNIALLFFYRINQVARPSPLRLTITETKQTAPRKPIKIWNDA